MQKPSKLIFTDALSIDIDTWLKNMAQEHSLDSDKLKEACLLARCAGEEHATQNGESCLHQGLAMAEILADIHLDSATLAAAIVYSSVHHADLTIDDIDEHLGVEVAKLVRGTCQMDAVQAFHSQLTQRAQLASTIDNLRKMLLAIVDDVRVVFIKLAERLRILKNMLVFNETETHRLAQETMDIYAPLANRLGIGHLKWQLEDFAFRYLYPEAYHELSRGLRDRRADRETYVRTLIFILQQELEKEGLANFQLTGRAKHIYSIYRKMQRKKVSLDEIYDAIAIRILVPTLEDCYAALGTVHTLWQPISKEFDDYIIRPKSDGYRSIHTAVIGPKGKFVEIQFRTFEMHQEAELGVAAHWIYKEGSKQSAYDQKTAWLRQVIDWQKEVAGAQTQSQEILSHLVEDHIYVFTPHGDIIDLPAGSTPLDFAYHIHSELGHHCKGAKIDGVIVPLTYSLKTGQKIEILSSKQHHPSRDWLNPHHGYLKTARAKAKVHAWFRKQDYDRNLTEGHEQLEKELKRLGIKDLSIETLADRLNYKSREELYAAIGRGDLRLHQVVLTAQSLLESPAEAPKLLPMLPEALKVKSLSPSSTDIVCEGLDRILTHLARCCKPIPGDEIVGYITLGKGVSIHRVDCQNVMERFQLYPDRNIAVSWGSDIFMRYPVDLVIIASHKANLIQDITGLLALEKVALLALNVTPNRKQETLIFHMTIEISSSCSLPRLMAKMSQLQGVLNVQRD